MSVFWGRGDLIGQGLDGLEEYFDAADGDGVSAGGEDARIWDIDIVCPLGVGFGLDGVVRTCDIGRAVASPLV